MHLRHWWWLLAGVDFGFHRLEGDRDTLSQEQAQDIIDGGFTVAGRQF